MLDCLAGLGWRVGGAAPFDACEYERAVAGGDDERLEGEDFASAESALRRVLNSPHADDVMTTIARIELGWLTSKTRRETVSNEHYDRAMRDLSLMVPEKQRLIREALPVKVRTEWENVDYLHKEPSTTETDP